MQLSYLSLTFAIIIVMSIMHPPEIEARAFSETDAVSESEAGFGSWMTWLLKTTGGHLVKIMKELKEEKGPGPYTWNTMRVKLIQEYPYLVKEIAEELKKREST